MRPRQTAKAQEYSKDEKIFLCMMVATSIVGRSLQERNTTLVGKLMYERDILDRADELSRHRVRSWYALIGATRLVSPAIYFRSKKEHTVTLSGEGRHIGRGRTKR